MTEKVSELQKKIAVLADWLEGKAIPLWLTTGFDEASGGFFERIGQDGTPMVSDNRRARVQPRQVYCAIEGGLHGYHGEWRRAAEQGLAYFDRFFLKPDSFYGALAGPDSMLINDEFDLYNQAFALFAFSQYVRAFPHAKAEMEDKATTLLERLKQRYKHPVAGFEEDNPARLPLCSNPHMHLFEATLAWEEVAATPAPWIALANEIAGLAMTKFIDARSGGLREFFDHDWDPYPGDKGRIMEPGHQLEWSWLLARWGALRGNDEALEKAGRLFQIAVDHGLSADGKVMIMGLYDDFSVHDPIARMWPQSEWLKAATKLASLSKGTKREDYIVSAIKACDAIQLFLEAPMEGLWYDKRKADGSFVDEPAPASTFYHIVCAIYEVQHLLG